MTDPASEGGALRPGPPDPAPTQPFDSPPEASDQPPPPAPGTRPLAPPPGEAPLPTYGQQRGEVTVVVDRVSKWFGNVVAVSDVSFALGPGVTAILGPNGAGKSTLMRILCGLTTPSQGSIALLGRDPRTDPGVRREIGLVPQQEQLFQFQRAIEFVELAGRLNHVDNAAEAARAALATVEMDPDDTRPVGTYSKGMRQRVKLAQALVANPRIIVADEPLNGLDPRQRQLMTQLLRRLGEEGRTVLVSSHVLDEVERFGSRVVVIVQGRLAAIGDFRAIRDLMDDRPHRYRLVTDRPRALAGRLASWEPVVGVGIRGDELHLDVADADGFRRGVMLAARECDALVTSLTPLDDDLESVFRYLVGS